MTPAHRLAEKRQDRTIFQILDSVADATRIDELRHAPWITFGNSQTGVIITYGIFGCRIGPEVLLEIRYSGQGSSEICCEYQMAADPILPSGRILYQTCAEEQRFSNGTVATVNGDGSCTCGQPVGVPVEDATWGRIKSLFAVE